MRTANGNHKDRGSEAFRHRGWNERYPHLGTGQLPTEVFVSQEQFELERHRIFKKVWLNLGRVEQIPEVGDYFVEDIAMCQTSIIVVRGKDGEIRAFHNMCSHRGNKIAWNHCGSCQVFTCKFHGWAFGLDGALQHVPDEEDFFDLQRDEAGLTRVACDVWEGFVFVNLDPNPEESLEAYLGDLATGLHGYPFAELTTSCNQWTTEINANWKLAQDAFKEGYHIKTIHKRTGAGTFANEKNPYAHWVNVELHPRHARGSVTAYEPKRRNPSKPSVLALAGKHGFLSFSSVHGESGEDKFLPGVNPTRHKDWVTDLNTVFPNFLIIVAQNNVVTHNFWPLDVNRTFWRITQYYPKAQTIAQRFAQNCGHAVLRDIAMEDGSTLEQTHSTQASGARKGLFLKDDEILIRHGHKVVDQMIKGQPLDHPAPRQEQDLV